MKKQRFGKRATDGSLSLATRAGPVCIFPLLLLVTCGTREDAASALNSGNETRSAMTNRQADVPPMRDGQYGELRIARSSRVGVRIEVAPAEVSRRRSPDQVRLGLYTAVVRPIADRLRSQGADPAIFDLMNTEVPDGPSIWITQRVDVDKMGGPYRITLNARQGQSYWTASVNRQNGTNPNYRGIADESGKANPEAYFEAIAIDTQMLAARLAKAIKIGGNRK